MPKPINMTIEVEELLFGKVWRTLDAMPGVVAIHLQGHGPKKTNKPALGDGRKKPQGGPTTPALVLSALSTGEEMNRAQLGEIIEANGKKKASLPDTITKLKNAKHIKIVGKGIYKITAAGQKAVAEQSEK